MVSKVGLKVRRRNGCFDWSCAGKHFSLISAAMDTELMTLKEVAQYLQLAEPAISCMARDGELAAQKFGNAWRFSRTAVEVWKAAQPVVAAGLPEPLTVAGAMSTEHMNLAVKGADKDAVLHELVGMVIERGNKRHAELFFQALKSREDLCSTCVNDGIACIGGLGGQTVAGVRSACGRYRFRSDGWSTGSAFLFALRTECS